MRTRLCHIAPIMLCTISGLALVAGMNGCASEPKHEPEPTASRVPSIPLPPTDATTAAHLPGLHQVVAYTPDLVSGSAPEGAEAFDTLSAMGFKTIISVDGAVPEVEAARVKGLRYVHLPIGYDGFDETRQLELARAVRDLPKPIYLHCHHGKHRSAGAAATIAVALGQLTNEQAMARMKVSETAAGYKGLWACAADASPLDQATLDAAPGVFPEVSQPSDFVAAMVEIDVISEHLKEIRDAGWRVPPEHPDLVPASEAGKMVDLYRLMRERHSAGEPAEFGAFIDKGQEAAQRLEDFFAASRPINANSTPRLEEAWKALSKSCKDCHTKFRD